MRIGAGLLAGLVAGLLMTVLFAVLRILAGVPLPVELISDRIIPTLSIRQFFDLAAFLGGLLHAKELSLLSSFAIQGLAGAAGGVIYAALRRRAVLVAGVGLGVLWALAAAVLWPVLESNYRGIPPGPARLLNLVALLLAFALYGAALVFTHRAIGARRPVAEPAPSGPVIGRRTLLAGGLGALLAVFTAGLARVLYGRATIGPSGYDGLQVRGPRTDPITPNDRFYVVTKNLIDPEVDRSLWRLEVTGAVDRSHTYTFDELSALPAIEQIQTLECISNPVGGGLMSNAVWRGVTLRTLIDASGPNAEADRVVLHASDGYVHVLPIGKAAEPTTLVAYEMNGAPLPHRHGYPARILVPGTYGEVSVKWVDTIEVTAEPVEGYYERQGWEPFFVETTSRFDRPRNSQRFSLTTASVIELGGVAFAGDRGISAVEITADGGATWEEATIEYAPSPLAWAVWSSEWRPSGKGEFVLRVRATDGEGAVQTATRRFIAPSGATGHHEVKVFVDA